MSRFLSILLPVVVLCSCSTTACHAFSVVPTSASTALSGHSVTRTVTPPADNELIRSSGIIGTEALPLRQWFTNSILTAFFVSSISGTVLFPQSASASYSAYAHREEDWQQRVAQNSIQVSNPKLLRDQLRQIAPMNEERSRIFCPNGPSAAVTPLMENRCSDLRQATPSVFGRSDDVVGNSIPGFNKEWASSIYSSAADPGGLPEYGFTKSSRK